MPHWIFFSFAPSPYLNISAGNFTDRLLKPLLFMPACQICYNVLAYRTWPQCTREGVENRNTINHFDRGYQECKAYFQSTCDWLYLNCTLRLSCSVRSVKHWECCFSVRKLSQAAIRKNYLDLVVFEME